MKIVHVVSGYLPQDSGGTQMQLRDLCHAQVRHGHEVAVFTRIGGQEKEELSLSRDEWEGVAVFRLTNNFLGCDSFESLFSRPEIDDIWRQFLLEQKAELVHVHHLSCLSTSMVAVAKELDLPVVMWLSDYWMVCPRGQRIHPDDLSICETLDRERCLPCLQKLWPHLLPPDEPEASMAKLLAWEAHTLEMIGLCDALLMPSAFHRDRFIEAGAPAERCHVVRYGLERSVLSAEPRGRKPVRHVGYLGTLLPSKGVHCLIEAFARLARPDLVLDIHGELLPFHEKTDYMEELQALVPTGLDVRFHGRYENRDLPEIMAGLDLLVVPSLWWESYCLTAREGALAGLPVVVFSSAGLAEAVDEGLALGCDVGDVDGLAKLIARVCDDAELRDEMSRKADIVRDISGCAAEIEGLYASLLPAAPSVLSAEPAVTVLIPTWNAGAEFPEVLERMLDQDLDRPKEVLVIDSGSTDGTAELLRKQPVRLITIPNEEFNHGLTRNLGIREANGEIVALATQDALPFDEHWLQRLVDGFRDPQVAGVYSGQLPRVDANPFIKDRLSHWVAAGQEPRMQRIESEDSFDALAPLEKLGMVAFDNVSSSVRREVALEIPFRRRQFGEDLDWGHRALLAGHSILFEPRSKVVHSHNNSMWYEFKRVYLDHQNLHRLFGVHTVPRWQDVLTCSKQATRHLWAVVERDERLSASQRWWWRSKALPFAISQNLAQYLGARSVAELERGRGSFRALDKVLRRGV